MVTEKPDCNVEVKFPCSSSLPTEFSQRTKLESFWLFQQPKDELSATEVMILRYLHYKWGIIIQFSGPSSSTSIRISGSRTGSTTGSTSLRVSHLFGTMDFQAFLKERQPQPPPIPNNFFSAAIHMPEHMYYKYVIQFRGAIQHFAKLPMWNDNKGLKEGIHGMWIAGTDNHLLPDVQKGFDKNLIDLKRTLDVWPDFESPGHYAVRFRNDHCGFWERQWSHGIPGPMKQRQYFDFVLASFDIIGPILKECLAAHTEEVLGMQYLDVTGFRNQMELEGLFPVIMVEPLISKGEVFGVTAQIQVLWDVRVFMSIADPRITLDPSVLNELSNFTTDLDVIIL